MISDMLQPDCEDKSEEFVEKTGNPDDISPETLHVLSSSKSPSSSSEAKEEGDSPLTGNQLNQIILYDSKPDDAQDVEPINTRHPLRLPHSSRVLQSIGAYAIQCAKCFKWRVIPTQQRYEEIREHISEDPFFCETAREWRPEISCDDETDISQDGTRLWAIDKPNIAQPPPGWKRLLHIRGEGSTKFADVYYLAPSGKKLRSMVEIQKFLNEHPEYCREGVTPSRFSFQIPKPLQEDYVRKRPARLMSSRDETRTHEPTDATPLSWVGPEAEVELELGMPGPTAETAFNPSPMKKPRQQPETQTQLPNHHIGDPSHAPPPGFETDKPVEPRTASNGGGD